VVFPKGDVEMKLNKQLALFIAAATSLVVFSGCLLTTQRRPLITPVSAQGLTNAALAACGNYKSQRLAITQIPLNEGTTLYALDRVGQNICVSPSSSDPNGTKIRGTDGPSDPFIEVTTSQCDACGTKTIARKFLDTDAVFMETSPDGYFSASYKRALFEPAADVRELSALDPKYRAIIDLFTLDP
jgi:hypothetical protein